MVQGMPLRIEQSIMDKKSPIAATTHYIDASPKKTENYDNPITIGDKTVFVSDAGKKALADNADDALKKHKDNPLNNNMKITEDANFITDMIWGVEEEGVVE